MSLKDIQQQIFNFLSGKQSDPDQLEFVKESKGIDRKTRLGSYKDSFINRAVSSIESDFAVTGIFLGVEDFSGYIEKYLKEFPSRTHYINEISKELPQYINRNLPEKAAPFVVELAKMEWLMIECFYNYYNLDSPPREKAPEGETEVLTNPSLVLYQSAWPLDKVWNEEKEFDKNPSYLSLWALDDRIVRVAGWNSLEFKVLRALQSSTSLEQSIGKLENVGSTEEISQVYSQCLPYWIKLGIINT